MSDPKTQAAALRIIAEELEGLDGFVQACALREAADSLEALESEVFGFAGVIAGSFCPSGKEPAFCNTWMEKDVEKRQQGCIACLRQWVKEGEGI